MRRELEAGADPLDLLPRQPRVAELGAIFTHEVVRIRLDVVRISAATGMASEKHEVVYGLVRQGFAFFEQLNALPRLHMVSGVVPENAVPALVGEGKRLPLIFWCEVAELRVADEEHVEGRVLEVVEAWDRAAVAHKQVIFFLALHDP